MSTKMNTEAEYFNKLTDSAKMSQQAETFDRRVSDHMHVVSSRMVMYAKTGDPVHLEACKNALKKASDLNSLSISIRMKLVDFLQEEENRGKN